MESGDRLSTISKNLESIGVSTGQVEEVRNRSYRVVTPFEPVVKFSTLCGKFRSRGNQKRYRIEWWSVTVFYLKRI